MLIFPTVTDGRPILLPGVSPVRRNLFPISFQLVFQFVVPGGVMGSVIGSSAISKPVRRLQIIGGLPARRYGFSSGGLFHSTADGLIRVRLVPANVMLRLIPITFHCHLDAIPGTVMFFGPPFWIFVLVHFVSFVCM